MFWETLENNANALDTLWSLQPQGNPDLAPDLGQVVGVQTWGDPPRFVSQPVQPEIPHDTHHYHT